MNLNVLSRSVSTLVHNQKAKRHWQMEDHPCLSSDKLAGGQAAPPARPQNPDSSDKRPKVWLEDIKVTADEKSMYCKGCVHSQGAGHRSKVVVAVEWLDEDRKALNTDWQRIEIDLAGKAAPCLPNTMQPFMVQAALDRRVKWVNAYAFSGKH